ncbi:hypothetical protein ADEAN_000682500 [Angomonas deanei]|uniref:Uncharacterized protein n=1 Tax=Angomonas deanei TaxID=59799 RepID=A0A7G2CHJ2_9TRYP|nr:hypothetical protein ADEAN_000682500 [Angomonas deanei]
MEEREDDTYHDENDLYAFEDYNDDDDEETKTRKRLRHYLPVPSQMEVLHYVKTKKIVEHAWTTEDFTKTAELRSAYTPKNNNHNSNHYSQTTHATGASLPMRSTLEKNETFKKLTEWNMIHSMAEGNNPQNVVQLKHKNNMNSFSQAESSGSPLESASLTQNKCLSPFLPKKLLKTFESHQSTLLGDSQPSLEGDSLSFSQFSNPTQSMTTTLTEKEPSVLSWEEVARTTQQWSERHTQQEEKFYDYITNPKRNEFLEKNVKITAKNRQYNRQLRIRTLQHEKKELEKRLKDPNYVAKNNDNGTVLWVTDDSKRSAYAQEYKKEQQGNEGDGGQKKKAAPAALADQHHTNNNQS